MIKFEISSQIVELAPDESVEINLMVINTSQIIDNFEISLEPLVTPETAGLNPAWVQLSPPTFALRPKLGGTGEGDTEREIKFKVSLPPQTVAGNYAGRIVIRAQSGPENSAVVPFNLVVSAVEEQLLELVPVEQSSRRGQEIYRVTLANRGNSPHLYALYAEDEDDECRFQIVPSEVTLQPSEQTLLTLKVRPRRRNWASADRNYPFTIKLEGFRNSVAGVFVQRCALPPVFWLGRHWGRLAILFTMLLALSIAALIFLLPKAEASKSADCGPTSQRQVRVVGNNFQTEIQVSGRAGTPGFDKFEQYARENAAILPGVFSQLAAVSPDGRRLAYVTASNLALDNAVIKVIDLDTPGPNRPVVFSWTVPNGLWPAPLVWAGNGERLTFARRTPKADGAVKTTAAAVPNGSPGQVGASPSPSTAQTPGAASTSETQLTLLAAEIGKKDLLPLGSPSRLQTTLFYGDPGRILCWDDNNANVLLRPRADDSKEDTQLRINLEGTAETIGLQASSNFKLDVTSPLKGGPNTGKTGLVAPLTRPAQAGAGLPLLLAGPVLSSLDTRYQQTVPAGLTQNSTAQAATGCVLTRLFSQNDPRWSDAALNKDSTGKLGEFGCPIVAAAMVINYHNYETDPGAVNTCLGNRSAPLNQTGWNAIAGECGNFKVEDGKRSDFDWSRLDLALQSGPAIVGLLGGPTGTHFVVVTGGSEGEANSYQVVDPWDGKSGKTLGQFLTWGYRPRWLVSFAGTGLGCTSDTVPGGIRIQTDQPYDGRLFQQAPPFQFNATGGAFPTGTFQLVRPGSQNVGVDAQVRPLASGSPTLFSDDGTYTVEIQARNEAGQKTAERKIYFTLDNTRPEVTARLSPTPDKITSKSNVPVKLQFTAKDDLSGIASIQYQVNGGDWKEYTSDTIEVPVTLADNGSYSIFFFAIDGAGNSSSVKPLSFGIEQTVTTGPGGGRTNLPTPTVQPIQPARPGGVGGPPTVTPIPTNTPRPVIRIPTTSAAAATNTPGVTPTLALPGLTPTVTVMATTPSALSPSVSPSVSLTPAVSPSPTAKPAALLKLDVSQVTFAAGETTKTIKFSNVGTAPGKWLLAPGDSSTLLNFSAAIGTLDPGTETSLTLSVITPNTTEANQTTSFSLSMGGETQKVDVTIDAKPFPLATIIPPNPLSLELTATVRLNVTVPAQAQTPQRAVLIATYRTCFTDSCLPQDIVLTDKLTASANWTYLWNTTDIHPQNDIKLSAQLCTGEAPTSCRPVSQVVSGLSVPMEATFVAPTQDKILSNATTIQVNASGRAARVVFSYDVNGTPFNLNTEANAGNGWKVTWDTTGIAPSVAGNPNPVVLKGKVCDGLGDEGCLNLSSVTGLSTEISGTVGLSQNFALNPVLSEPLTITVTPISNLTRTLVYLHYKDDPSLTTAQPTAHLVTELNSTGQAQTYSWTPTGILAQPGIRLQVLGCYTTGTDLSRCTDLANFPNLKVQAGAPAFLDTLMGSQTTFIGTVFTDTIKVRVTDLAGNPVGGQNVRYETPPDANGASASFVVNNSHSFTSLTDDNGVLTAPTLKANLSDGTFNLTALVVDNPAIVTTILLVNDIPGAPPIQLQPNVDAQQQKILKPFGTPLTVKLVDAAGNTPSNVPVTFKAPTGEQSGSFDGTLKTAVVNTTLGIATAPPFIAGTKPGSYQVSVSADGYKTALINLTNLVGDPAVITLVGVDNQQIEVQTDAQPFTVKVTDGFNELVGEPIKFAAPDPAGPSGTFTDATGQAVGSIVVTTTIGGLATSPVLRANQRADLFTPYLITVASTKITSVEAKPGFKVTNKPGAAKKVVKVAPTAAQAQVKSGQSNPGPYKAQVFDAFNNLVPNADVTFQAPDDSGPLPPPSGRWGNLTTGLFATSVKSGSTVNNLGLATTATPLFGNCTLGGYNLTLSVPGATSDTVGLTNIGGDPFIIAAVAGGGQTKIVNGVFDTKLKAVVRDSCNPAHPLDGYTVRFEAPSSGASGTFANGLSFVEVTTSVNGEYTAPDFKAGPIAGAYTVKATVVGSPALTAANFDLVTNIPGPPAKIEVVTGISSPASRIAGTVKLPYLAPGTPFRVRVRDANDNLVSDNELITFTAPTANGVDPTGTFTDATNQPVSSLTVKTGGANPKGEAAIQAGTFVAGKKAGPFEVTITAGGATPATIYLLNTAGVPDSILAQPDPLALTYLATVDDLFKDTSANPLDFRVKVLDDESNPILITPVKYEVKATGPAGKVGGFFNLTDTVVNVTTDATGLAFTPSLKASQRAGNFTLQVTAGTAALTFNLTNLPDTTAAAVKFQDVGGPTGVVVTNRSATVTQPFIFAVRVEDKFQNPIPNSPVSFARTSDLTSPAPQATGDFTPSAPTQTDATGFIVLNGSSAKQFVANLRAGNYSLTATAGLVSGILNLQNKAETTPGSLVATPVTTALTPLVATVGTNFTDFFVTVRDQYLNPINGAVVSFTLNPNGTVTGSFVGGVSTGLSDANGELHVGGTAALKFTAGTVAGDYSLTAATTVASKTATFNLRNKAGTPDAAKSTLDPPDDPVVVTVGQAFAKDFVITVRDANSNLLDNIDVTFSLSSDAVTGATGTFALGPVIVNTGTGGTGKATAPKVTANQKTGNYKLTASFGGTSKFWNLQNQPDQSATITPTAGQNQTLLVGDTATPFGVSVIDQYTNKVKDGTSIQFATEAVSGNAGGTFAGTGKSNTTGGAATSPAFTANDKVGVYKIRVSDANNAAVFNNTLSVINTVDLQLVGSASMSALVGDTYPNFGVRVVGGGTLAAGVNGIDVEFTSPDAKWGTFGTSGTATNRTVTSAGGGLAQVADFRAGNGTDKSFVGSFTVTAVVTIPGTAITVSKTFTLFNGVQVDTVASTSGQTRQAGGEDFTPLRAIVRGKTATDLVSGVPVTFSVTNPNRGTFTPAGGVVNSAATTGEAQIAFKSGTFVGNYTVTARVANGPTTTDTALFDLTNTLTLEVDTTTDNQTALANGGVFGPLKLTVKGAGGNPLGGQAVTFSVTAANRGSFTPASGIATSDPTTGVVSIDFTAGTFVGTYTVTAKVQVSPTVSVQQTFTLTNTVTLAIDATTDNQTRLVNGEAFAALKITVKGAGTNTVPNVPVTFSVTNTNFGTFTSGTAGVVNSNATTGIAAINYKSGSFIGSYIVTAKVVVTPGVTVQQSFNLTNNVAIALTNASDNQEAKIGTGFTNALKVRVTDFQNNPVTSLSLTFKSSDVTYAEFGSAGSGTLTVTSSTDGNGDSTGTVNLFAGSKITAPATYNDRVSVLVTGTSIARFFTLKNCATSGCT